MLRVRGIGWRPITTASWMRAAFLIALALTVVILVIFGIGERGAAIALRATARWAFLLFWLAYAGSAVAWLCRPHLDGLARHGRELGLAFASAQLVHVGLVLWITHIAKGPVGAMVFFWVGIFCTYLLALFSMPRLRDELEPRFWGYSARLRWNTSPSPSPPILSRCTRTGSASLRWCARAARNVNS
jgi:hypothetical protein